MVILRLLWLAVFCAFLLSAVAAQSPRPPTPAEAAVSAIGSTMEPCPALASVARVHSIPIDGIDPFGEGASVNPGDSITALITLVEKSRRTQWLLYVNADPQPFASTNKPSKRVMYSSTGRKVEFESARVPVTLRTLGPFEASERKHKLKAADKTAQVTLRDGYLGLGLDNAAKAVLRVRETKIKGGFAFAPHPFSEAEIAKAQKLTNIVHLTAAEERALAGAGPAMESFFSIVQNTEGLSDILFKLVNLPSMWSIARNKGVTVNFRFKNEIKQREVGVSKFAIYEIPIALELNGQNALNFTMVATRPQPPLLASAGILGLVATRPGAKDTYLAVQVISAKRAQTKTNAVANSFDE